MRALVLSSAALAVFVISASAQPPSQIPPPATAALPNGAMVDPAASAALQRMSDYVAHLQSLEIKTKYSFDVVTRDDQTVTVDGTGHYLARRPDKLHVDIQNDIFSRRYIYDGKTLTIVAPDENYYAQFPAKPTIREMLSEVAQRLAIELPLADLFDLGTSDSPINDIQSAFVVGESMLDDAEAQHLALRTEDRDWELWIRTGDKPLPVKFVLTDKTQPERPRYAVTLNWVERSEIPDSEFSFVPSPDDKPIAVLRLGKPDGG